MVQQLKAWGATHKRTVLGVVILIVLASGLGVWLGRVNDSTVAAAQQNDPPATLADAMADIASRLDLTDAEQHIFMHRCRLHLAAMGLDDTALAAMNADAAQIERMHITTAQWLADNRDTLAGITADEQTIRDDLQALALRLRSVPDADLARQRQPQGVSGDGVQAGAECLDTLAVIERISPA